MSSVRILDDSKNIVGESPLWHPEHGSVYWTDVNGFKMPFKVTHTWLDGREIMELTQIRTNVAVDAARFNKPAPAVAPKPKA